MQTLRGVRKRIAGVRGTVKIVSAMKMISAARLKRVQERMMGARLYSERMKELGLQVATKGGDITHPAFVLRPKIKKAILVVITAARGFCGPLCENMYRQTDHFSSMMKDRNIEIETWVVGSKGVRTFRRHDCEFEVLDFPIGDQLDYKRVEGLSQRLLEMFLSGRCDQVVLAYSRFLSAVSHQVTLDMFLPIWVKEVERPVFTEMVDFLYEPSRGMVIDRVLNDTLKSSLARALYEGRATELAARMVSMDQAFSNATDMVNRLEREYNRARQASITKELMDIVGGAEALKG